MEPKVATSHTGGQSSGLLSNEYHDNMLNELKKRISMVLLQIDQIILPSINFKVSEVGTVENAKQQIANFAKNPV
jgi:hypothetical protein